VEALISVEKASKEAQGNALSVLRRMSGIGNNAGPVFKTSGLMELLINAAKGSGDARDAALNMIENISSADDKANAVAMFETSGLMEGLVSVVAEGKGTGYSYARMYALTAINNISSTADNRVPMFNTSGLVEALNSVVDEEEEAGKCREDAINALEAIKKAAE